MPQEETGLDIPIENTEFFKTVYVKYPDYDFVYHIFHTKIKDKNEIKINTAEHKNAKWISPNESLLLPLIEDLDICIKLFFKN